MFFYIVPSTASYQRLNFCGSNIIGWGLFNRKCAIEFFC
jgi:hypothetical protein